MASFELDGAKKIDLRDSFNWSFPTNHVSHPVPHATVKTEREVLLKNKPGENQRLHEFVEEFCHEHQLSTKVAFSVGVALEEHLTNIIGYAFDDAREHLIRVQFRLTDDELRIEVEDDGRAFNPAKHPEPDTTLPLDQKPIGGLGIHMIRKSMNGMEYRRQDGKNILVLKKKIG